MYTKIILLQILAIWIWYYIGRISKVKGMKEHLGSFKTEIEAFKAYKIAKESFVKEQANKWKDEIDERAYEALMNYQVEITD